MDKRVLILMGSDSDYVVMKEAVAILEEFGVGFEVSVSSAHRTPARTRRIASSAEKRGFKVIIIGAGAAAHLAGVVAAETVLPVIGIPIASTPLNGVDALYSTVQMPGGIPVATMAIGKAGAKNGSLFAVEILALEDPRLREKIKKYRKKMAQVVEKKNREIGVAIS